mmetsp:Transcript_10680/g.13261  ORF Transcript_10680/g.13261 Transcript_10680/m.13261 type:complete len:87 (+) Transcript_10680:225-485(+)
MVRNHNADKTQTYRMGQNQFSDLSEQEFNAGLGLKQATPNSQEQAKTDLVGKLTKDTNGTVYNFEDSDIPDSVDWRDKDAVTPIQD